ncbi:MAG: peroxiredoxin [Thermoplasmata archaeon]|nr:MAG: peroxiredoxin [Thermoplasmata archaeon]
MEEVKVGDSAKDFTLKDQNGEEVKLSSLAGKKVLLSFHPLAWTEICAKQMQSLEANKETFDSMNTVALGMSVDTIPSKKAWADVLVIRNTQLLSDFWPHGEVAKSYDIFNEERGISKRANIIIDENQKIAFVKVYEIKTLPDINEIIEFIRNM